LSNTVPTGTKVPGSRAKRPPKIGSMASKPPAVSRIDIASSEKSPSTMESPAITVTRWRTTFGGRSNRTRMGFTIATGSRLTVVVQVRSGWIATSTPFTVRVELVATAFPTRPVTMMLPALEKVPLSGESMNNCGPCPC